MAKPAIREPDQISQNCVHKLRAKKCSSCAKGGTNAIEVSGCRTEQDRYNVLMQGDAYAWLRVTSLGTADP